MSGLLPLIQRELRVAARRGPTIRGHWKTLGWAAFTGILLLVVFRMGHAFNLIQGTLGLMAYALSRGPMVFAEDQAAGSQSLLRLAGLDSAQVFWGSLLGSLMLILEGALLMMPVLITGLWWCGARPNGVILLTLLPIAVLVLGTILKAVGRLCARSVAAANSIASGFGALAVGVPLLLEWLLTPHLGPVGRMALHVAGGLRDWSSISATCVGRDVGAGVGRLLLRLLVWSVLFSGLATWLFHRQWRQADTGGGTFSRWRAVWGGTSVWRRSQLPLPPDSAYGWRLRRNRSWTHGFMLLAIVVGFAGVLAAIFFPWPTLVITAIVYWAAVDTLLHLAVSQPVAEDRLEGTLELLLTTSMERRELFEELNAEAKRLRWVAEKWGVVLSLGLLALALAKLVAAGNPTYPEWLAWVLVWCWPLTYAVSLRWLSFDLPAWQAANAASSAHLYSPPKTPMFMVLGSLALGLASGGIFSSLLLTAGFSWVVVFGWVLMRNNIAADSRFAPDDLRIVAAAPLPTEPMIKAQRREDRKPMVPAGFVR